MSADWDFLYADSFFAPAPFATLVVPTSEIQNNVDLAPVTWVDGVVAAGYAYNRIVVPVNEEIVAPTVVESELDSDELRAAVMSADLNDFYGLLNLGVNNFDVDIELVKKNFKLINLVCHPDKADPAHRKAAEVRFKAIQLAYDTLTDPQSKIEYDSEVDFDDDIPGPKAGTKDLDDFLKTYYPVFERNAVFSTIKPVPMLGDANTTKAELDHFYNFWFSFKSWREFTHGDTEKVGSSAGREERRRAAKGNRKVRETLKKAEVARLRKLVTQANDIDPRVKYFKAKAIEEAKAAKEAAFLKKKADEEARLKKIADERAAKAAAEKAIADAKEKERLQAIKVTLVTNKIRGAIVREPTLAGQTIVVDKMVSYLTAPERVFDADAALTKAGFTDAKGQNGKDILSIDIVKAAYDDATGAAAANAQLLKQQLAERKRKEEEDAARRSVWTIEELSALAKATQKIVVGTRDRWAKIADMVNLVHREAGSDFRRTEKDILRQLKEQDLTRQVGAEAFEQFKKDMAKQKERAVKYNEPTVAVLVHGEETRGTFIGGVTTTTVTPAAAATMDKDDPVNWGREEQQLLEKGLKEVPKDAADRWEQIAAIVGTRNAVQCQKRFTHLKNEIAKKKAAAAAAAQK